MFVRFKDQRMELSDGPKVYEGYASIEERYQENGKIKTKVIAALGRQPTPEKLVKTIEKEDLDKNKEKLLKSFYTKADYLEDDYEDFDDFLDKLDDEDFLEDVRKERALRELIASSFDDIFDNLSPFEEIDDKFKEVKIPDSESRADLLAEDQNGEIIVIELKIGTVDDEVVGQINRYINDLSDVLEEKEVRGIVIGEEFSGKFKSGIRGLKNEIDTRTYSLKFRVS